MPVEKPGEELQPVSDHYNAAAAGYHEQYQRDLLYSRPRYPGNYFRLQLLLNAFVEKQIRRVVEVGVGEGTPLLTLAQAGLDVWGFDIAEKMVEQARATVAKAGIGSERIIWGDIQDPITYASLLKHGPFDGLMAMGVMPHVENDDLVIGNMATLVRPGGSVFIEFRNKLFSLFTFNRYTFDFIMDDLLCGVSQEVRDMMATELQQHLRMDLPPARRTDPGTDQPDYDAILSRFHNPLEVPALFARHGFTDLKLLWYHYHPAMPRLEGTLGTTFRKEAVRLEHEASGWRGMFLCSAFVVEATKGDRG
jgi:2-polyprenyl-3-methyl-5-hydroxy-6-metoxy-1,4-benzoquinol methylase